MAAQNSPPKETISSLSMKRGKTSQNYISNNCENNNRLLDSVNCNDEVLIHEMEGVCPPCYQGYLFTGEDANIQVFLLSFP